MVGPNDVDAIVGEAVDDVEVDALADVDGHVDDAWDDGTAKLVAVGRRVSDRRNNDIARVGK